jgi:hypothetical protein
MYITSSRVLCSLPQLWISGFQWYCYVVSERPLLAGKRAGAMQMVHDKYSNLVARPAIGFRRPWLHFLRATHTAETQVPLDGMGEQATPAIKLL